MLYVQTQESPEPKNPFVSAFAEEIFFHGRGPKKFNSFLKSRFINKRREASVGLALLDGSLSRCKQRR